MTTHSLQEALKLSKETGAMFISSHGEYLKWYGLKGWMYNLTWTDIMARYRPIEAVDEYSFSKRKGNPDEP